MVVIVKFTAVFERDPDGRWIVNVPEVKGCHTYGRTIDQARERVREALGLFVENVDAAELVDKVRLPVALRKEIAAAKTLRARLLRDEQEMVAAQVRAVRALRKLRLGHRDAGRILGLSHQRVQQLEKRPERGHEAMVTDVTRGRAPRRIAAKKR